MWALASLGVENLPGPVSVAERGGEMLADGSLLDDTLAGLRRVFTVEPEHTDWVAVSRPGLSARGGSRHAVRR